MLYDPWILMKHRPVNRISRKLLRFQFSLHVNTTWITAVDGSFHYFSPINLQKLILIGQVGIYITQNLVVCYSLQKEVEVIVDQILIQNIEKQATFFFN